MSETALTIQELRERALVLQQSGSLTERDALRQIIRTVQAEISQMPENLGENAFPLDHQFAHGVYRRQVFLPAGSLVVGKIHRFEHFTLIGAGEVEVLNERGVFRYTAPCLMKTPAGTQNVVYAHQDTLWSTFHGTQHTDPDKAEEELSTKDYDELETLQCP